MIITTLKVAPAYGRKYKTREDAVRDWESNKDFQIAGTVTYINKEDAESYGVTVDIDSAVVGK
jgi:hypothetical protein